MKYLAIHALQAMVDIFGDRKNQPFSDNVWVWRVFRLMQELLSRRRRYFVYHWDTRCCGGSNKALLQILASSHNLYPSLTYPHILYFIIILLFLTNSH